MALPYPTRGVVTATDLSTDADVLPVLPGQDFLLSRDPNWSSGVHKTASGRSIRTSFMSSPTYTLKVRHNLLRNRPSLPELAKLVAFFNSRRGRYGAFFALDPEDSAALDEPMGIGDGVTTVFQAQRTVNKGGTYATAEPVYAFWLAPVFKVAGTITAATVTPWGVVTFGSAPAVDHAVTWSGSWLWVCAFTQDRLSVAQMVSLLWSQDGLEFESLRP